MTDLRELEKRLEEATGPDRAIDGLLHVRFDLLGRSTQQNDPGRYTVVGPPTYDLPRPFFCPDTSMDWIGYDLINVSPRYTASLDAAVALVERLGFFYRLQKETPVGQKAFLAKYWATVGPAGAQEAANAETGPVALMLALVRALIAKGDRHD